MTLTILDDSVSSDRSPHTARPAPGENHQWEVSWLPGRRLGRNEAITAMTLADLTADASMRPGHRLWPHIEGWAAELGLTGPQALSHVTAPPRWANRQEKTAGPPDAGPRNLDWRHLHWHDLDRLDIEPPDVDPPDLDPPVPEWHDPDWPGLAPGRRPTYMFNIAVSPWYKEHYPDKSANLWDALRTGRDPQPASELDKSADWEAGQ